jgi:CRP/FNR family cyclic AMP-dependent transcriptional regulator
MQRNYQLKSEGTGRASELARARLIALGRCRKFSAGQTIWQQGDPSNGFYAVISGSIRSSRSGADGSRSVFAVLGAGDFIGEPACILGAQRAATLEAVADAELVWISEAVFRKTVAKDPELLMLILRSVSHQFHVTVHLVDQGRRLPAVDRLAIILRSFRTGPDGVIQATHQELADMVGVSRVSLGSALGQLALGGAIQRSYGNVRILDRTALDRRVAMHRVSA